MPTAAELIRSIGNGNQYRDDRWKSRRSQYFATFDRTCRSCRRSDKPIQLHHVNYAPDKAVWEAADDELCPLCEDCHVRMTKCLRELRRAFSLHVPSHLAVRLAAAFSTLSQADPNGFLIELETIVSRKSRGA